MTVARVTIIGVVVNVILAAAKLAAGVLGSSAALLADAVHSLSDLVTDGAVLWGATAARRPADEDHAYGHGRYETLAALLVGGSLVFGAVAIALGQVRILLAGSPGGSPRLVAFWAASASILVKETLFRLTRSVARRTGSPAAAANAWHHRSDAMSSIAACVGVGGAVWFGDRAAMLDPIAAVVVSVMVAYVGLRIGSGALREMTDVGLSPAERAEIGRIILGVGGTSDPHNLKTRRLGRTAAIEVHFRVDGSMTVDQAHEIASRVEAGIVARFGSDTRVITHIEPRLQHAVSNGTTGRRRPARRPG